MLRHDEETLLFRRQFALGPRELPGLPSWRRVDVGEGWWLTAHPEVELAEAQNGNCHIVTAGIAVDTDRPEASASDVAADLLARLEGVNRLDAFADTLELLAGRWAVVARRGKELRVFQDAAGTRQLFLTTAAAPIDGAWCASSPDLLARALDIPADPQATLLDSPEVKRQREFWWPGTWTPYQGVRLLLPNHAFTGTTAQRYGPSRPVGRLAVDEAVARSVALLRAAVEGAAARRPLAISMTAGFDSRVSLAAARGVPRLLFSFVHNRIEPSHPDVHVPARLAARLGDKHLVFSCPSAASATFESAYRASNPHGNSSWAAVAESLYDNLPENVLRLTSTVSEIGRAYYRFDSETSASRLDGSQLVELSRLGSQGAIRDALDEWVGTIPTPSPVHPLDLFYWEQRLGSWAGTLFREWDISHEGYTPFSCRALMDTFLAVDESHRVGPHHELHTELIRALWPEALDEPINPPAPGRWLRRLRKRSQRVKSWLGRAAAPRAWRRR